MGVLCFAGMEKREKWRQVHSSSFYLPLCSRKAVKEAPANFPHKKRLHKLRFLQKLGCQKPCWDQVRLSSLVNKQVVLKGPIWQCSIILFHSVLSEFHTQFQRLQWLPFCFYLLPLILCEFQTKFHGLQRLPWFSFELLHITKKHKTPTRLSASFCSVDSYFLPVWLEE